jgi:hypothetical protein
MSTSNITISKTWTKVADDSDDPILITRSDAVGSVEVALTAADGAPSGIVGHTLKNEEGITRSAVGDGFVWMRLGAGSRNTTTSVVVTK